MTSAKWHVLSRVLPLVGVIVVVKIAVHVINWEPVSPNALFSGAIAATVFVLGFLLSGTMADFKESERLVGELAAAIESVADELRILSAGKAAEEARDCLVHLCGLAAATRRWLLAGDETAGSVLARVADLNPCLLALEPVAEVPFVARLKQEQAAIRRSLIRIGTLVESSSFLAGYAIAEILSAMLIGGLLLVEIDPFFEDVFFTVVISFLVTYVLALVRDLDHPFQLRGRRTGGSHVSLEPLDALEERLADSLSQQSGIGGRESRTPTG